MLKRTGKGHDLGGAVETRNGELAIECPACPIPGVNLPDGWEHADPDIQYVHPLNFLLE